MNEIPRQPPRVMHATAKAADGFPRLAWTLAEFERLGELGFFGGIESERERVELVDGEIMQMHAKGGRHEWVRACLQKHLTLLLGHDFDVFAEPGWRPGREHYVEPDIMVCPAGSRPASAAPGDVLLLIEISDTSQRYDLVKKASLYARLGVSEYWAINAQTLETRIHRASAEAGYQTIAQMAKDAALAPHLLPGFTLALGLVIAPE